MKVGIIFDIAGFGMIFNILGFGMDQAVIDICQADWYELKTNLKITSKMIDTSS